MAEARPKRKLGDVFLRILEDLGEEFTPAFEERFNQEAVSRLKRATDWEAELTEEEYQEELAHLRRELPGVIRRLQNSDVAGSLGFWRVDQN
jgi:hypothetical protein